MIRRENRDGSLAKICGKLGLSAQNLHNAGNDARYTLECMLRQVAMNPAQQAQYAIGPYMRVIWEEGAPAPFIVEPSSVSVWNPLVLSA